MVRTSLGGRTPVSRGLSLLCVLLMFAFGAPRAWAQRPAGRGSQRPAAAAPSAPAAAPQISATAIRVVGPGLGANGSELRPFNEQPGTTVALSVQAPRGSGIVAIDDDASKLEAFSDDKGQSLLEEGRVGPFPKVAEDGSVALFEVEVRARPSTGATSVSVQGTIAMTVAGGSKPIRAASVRLEEGQSFKIGSATLTIGETSVEGDARKITFGLPRSVLSTIREVRFFDAKNAPIEARRTGSGYFNEKAQLEVEAQTKDKTATVEFEMWQNLRTIKVPFKVQAGLGLAAGTRPAETADGGKTEKPAAREPEGPPPTVGPGEGAESVEAVVRQLQTSALAGKGAEVLSVIHPNDRGAFGQAVAMTMAFLPMSMMENTKAAEKVQQEVDAFYDKHQLRPPFTREPKDLFKGIDLAAFVSDAMVFLKSHAKKGENPADMLPIPPGRPQDVKVSGETAVATLNGKEINFTKIESRWFIRLK